MKKRKGSVEDILVIGAFIFAGAIATMFVYMILKAFSTDPNIVAALGTSNIFTEGMTALVIYGNSFLFVAIAFGLVAAISSFYTESHPVFFIFSLLSFSICMVVIAVLSDVFTALAQSSALLPIAAEFTAMVLLLTNYPIIAVIIAAVIFLALFTKRSDLSRGGGGQA